MRGERDIRDAMWRDIHAGYLKVALVKQCFLLLLGSPLCRKSKCRQSESTIIIKSWKPYLVTQFGTIFS